MELESDSPDELQDDPTSLPLYEGSCKTVLEVLSGYFYWFSSYPSISKSACLVCWATNILTSCLQAITCHLRTIKHTILLNLFCCLQSASTLAQTIAFFFEKPIVTITRNSNNAPGAKKAVIVRMVNLEDNLFIILLVLGGDVYSNAKKRPSCCKNMQRIQIKET